MAQPQLLQGPEAPEGVLAEGDDGVVRQVEGEEAVEAEEGVVAHLLDPVATHVELGEGHEAAERAAGQAGDGVVRQVERPEAGRQEDEEAAAAAAAAAGRLRRPRQSVVGQVEPVEVGEVAEAELGQGGGLELVVGQHEGPEVGHRVEGPGRDAGDVVSRHVEVLRRGGKCVLIDRKIANIIYYIILYKYYIYILFYIFIFYSPFNTQTSFVIIDIIINNIVNHVLEFLLTLCTKGNQKS